MRSKRFQYKCDSERERVGEEFFNHFNLDLTKYFQSPSSDVSDNQVHRIVGLALASLNKDVHFSNLKKENDLHGYKQAAFILEQIQSFCDKSCVQYPAILNLLETGQYSDVIIKVEDVKFYLHKDILCARSPYFAAMLQVHHRWTETNENIVQLNQISAFSFSTFACYLYGAFLDWKHNNSEAFRLRDLLIIADMLAFESLKEVLDFFLERDFCHFFVKPCPVCLNGVTTVIAWSDKIVMEELQYKCFKWSVKHLVRLWPTKDFCQLPKTFIEKISLTLKSSINRSNVVNITFEIDMLLGQLPAIHWAKPVCEIANELMNVCQSTIIDGLYELTKSKTIFPLFQGLGLRRDIVEEIGKKIISNISLKNACRQHVAVGKLIGYVESENWNQNVLETLNCVHRHTTNYLLNNYYAVFHTDGWKLLSDDEKENFRRNTLCIGDPQRRPRSKPVLSSSKKNFVSSEKKKTAQQSTTKERNVPLKNKSRKPATTKGSLKHGKTGQLQEKHVLKVSCSQAKSDVNEKSSITDASTLAMQPCFVTTEELNAEVYIPPTIFKPYGFCDPV